MVNRLPPKRLRRSPQGATLADRLSRIRGVCLAALWVAGSASAASVGSALDRPAVPAREPGHAVVLGAAQAGARLVVVGERGSVLLSDDAGASWRQAAVPVSVTLTAVRFVDVTHGFAVGHGGVVLATADAGATWVKRLDGVQAAALALQAAEASGDARQLKDAQRLVADGADKPLLDLFFADARHGIVVGAYNLAFETADGGAHWTSLMDRLDNPKALHLYTLRALGDTVVIAGEQGLVLRSDDHGQHFRRLELPYKGSFFTAEMSGADGREMLLAGLRGNVWRSTDAGDSWTQATVPTRASITGSALLPAALPAAAGDGATPRVVLVNQAGQVLEAPADAASFTAMPGAPLPPLNGVLPLASGGLLALSVAGPLRLAPPKLP